MTGKRSLLLVGELISILLLLHLGLLLLSNNSASAAGPDLSGSTKLVEPQGYVSPGDTLTYTIVLSNRGDTASVWFVDAIPLYTHYVTKSSELEHSDSIGTLDGAEGLFWAGTITANTELTFTFWVTVGDIPGGTAGPLPIWNQVSFYVGSQQVYSAAISVTARLLPLAGFTPSTHQPCAGQVVTFTNLSSSSPADTIYAWNWGDGSPELTTTTPTSPTHVFASPGEYIVYLTVTNTAGQDVFSDTISVSTIPAADFTTLPPVAYVNTPVVFSATNVAYNPTSWWWDFGDGEVSTTALTTTHIYTAAGTYTVTLAVSNSCGAASPVSHILTVRLYQLYLPLILKNYSPFTNGDFEAGWAGWRHGGELHQFVTSEIVTASGTEPVTGTYAALLGDPDYPCAGGVPLGSAWMEQTFSVPAHGTTRVVFSYRILTHDKSSPATEDTYDSFDVYLIHDSEKTLILRDYNSENFDFCNLLNDLGWKTFSYTLPASLRGTNVTLRFENVNRHDQFYNTYTYIDEVEVTTTP